MYLQQINLLSTKCSKEHSWFYLYQNGRQIVSFFQLAHKELHWLAASSNLPFQSLTSGSGSLFSACNRPIILARFLPRADFRLATFAIASESLMPAAA
mmetsp:Transcript_22548/g.38640  ORF Transcript_22548/g.38640 Transcript_22548/m.38640 type:complete len:98 (-) Transcript_22548:407-700(-)